MDTSLGTRLCQTINSIIDTIYSNPSTTHYTRSQEDMELTIPTQVTNARLEFSSLVFASNLSPTPPAAVTMSPQQIQNKYWIIPSVQKMELTIIPTPVTDDARSEFSSLVFASNLSPTPPAVVTAIQQQVQDQYWIKPVQETKYYNALSQLCC